ncbi:pyridoxine biosynthesis protein [Blastocladiella emersonii ATCC 22665]|nr:pyridoxine biosynthesis protein [Blastocladiella emersonii ATCC 22665]
MSMLASATRTVAAGARARLFHASAAHAAQNLMMPALSPTMTEGTLVKWHVQEGQTFSAGDILFEVETDKAQLEVDAQDDGTLAKIMVAPGTKAVKVNSVIAVVAEEGEDVASIDFAKLAPAAPAAAPAPPAPKPVAAAPAPTPAPAAAPAPAPAAAKPSPAPAAAAGRRHAHIGPAVSHLMHLYALTEADLGKVAATGPQGRLLKGDVLSYVAQRKLQPREVVHPEPKPVAPLFTPTTVEVPVSSTKVGTRQVLEALASVRGLALVVDGKPLLGARGAGAAAAAKDAPMLHVQLEGTHRVRKPEPKFALKSLAQELDFYDYLGGKTKPAASPRPSAAPAVAAPVQQAARKQDLFEFLGQVPTQDDPRFHYVLRVRAVQAPGFASAKDALAAVATVQRALANATL